MHLFFHFAYLDPSTGSLLVQSMVGVVAGIGIFGRRVITGIGHRIKSLFGKKD